MALMDDTSTANKLLTVHYQWLRNNLQMVAVGFNPRNDEENDPRHVSEGQIIQKEIAPLSILIVDRFGFGIAEA